MARTRLSAELENYGITHATFDRISRELIVNCKVWFDGSFVEIHCFISPMALF